MQTAALSAARPLSLGKAPFKAGATLPARPAAVAAPRRSARGAPLAVSARAAAKGQAYICVDCGYIYDGSEGPFDKLPSSYRCPVCSAPKRRFKAYAGTGRNDSKSMNARYEAMQRGGSGGSGGGGSVNSGAFLAAGLAAAVGLAGLWFYLPSQYN